MRPHRQRRYPSHNLTPGMWLRLRGLSPREAEAALLAAHGLRMREVADQMQVSEGTVKTELARAREKLGCGDVRDLVALLLHEGVVKLDDFLTPCYRQLGSELPGQPVDYKRSTRG